MYFAYDSGQAIHVEKPYQRVMVPYMMADTASIPLPFSVHLTEWGPGSQVDEHAHGDAMEAMYCIAGHGIATVGTEEYELKANSMIVAAPGELHCIKNTGNEIMRCLCIFSPPTTAEGLRKRANDAVDAAKENKNG